MEFKDCWILSWKNKSIFNVKMPKYSWLQYFNVDREVSRFILESRDFVFLCIEKKLKSNSSHKCNFSSALSRGLAYLTVSSIISNDSSLFVVSISQSCKVRSYTPVWFLLHTIYFWGGTPSEPGHFWDEPCVYSAWSRSSCAHQPIRNRFTGCGTGWSYLRDSSRSNVEGSRARPPGMTLRRKNNG